MNLSLMSLAIAIGATLTKVGDTARPNDLLPGHPNSPAIETNTLSNPSFEEGTKEEPSDWLTALNDAPVRSLTEAKSGLYSLHVALQNEGKQPSEGHLIQRIDDLIGGQTFTLSLWIKQVSAGISYVQQYKLDWIDEVGQEIESSGFKAFQGKQGEWIEFTAKEEAPPDAVSAVILFRFVTGAVDQAHGEAFLDDIALRPGVASAKKKANEQRPFVVRPLEKE